MTYLEYIKSEDSISKMKNLEEKGGASFALSEIYTNQTQKLSEIHNISPYLDGIKCLNRGIVFSAFEEDLYKGFVYAMLWGGLGVGQGVWRNLTTAMSFSKDTITEKLKRVKSLLDDGNLKEAFISMHRGNNKIKGIGPSYFTKILYFMYSKDRKAELYPLIYDKWGMHIHSALLLEAGQNLNSYGFLYIIGDRKKRCILYDIYDDYLKRMKALSDELKLKNPGILEEFLFGQSRKINRSTNNPRVVLLNYLRDKYDSSRTE